MTTYEALLFTGPEVCELVGLPKPSLNKWVARGDFVPAIKRGAGGRRGGHRFTAQQAIRLAFVAFYNTEARRKKTQLSHWLVGHLMAPIEDDFTAQELIDTLKPNQVACDEERVAKELAEHSPMPDAHPEKVRRVVAVLREIRRRLRAQMGRNGAVAERGVAPGNLGFPGGEVKPAREPAEPVPERTLFEL
jgi:hypothetical protein